MIKAIDILIIEDSDTDLLIVLDQLRKGGFLVKYERVETLPQLDEALAKKTWGAVVSDYNLVGFTALDTLKKVKQLGIDIPFIIVSGTIGEETAVAAMKEGAHDYIMKDNLARLVPALEREIREAATRESKRRVEQEKEETRIELQRANHFLSTLLDSMGDTAVFICNFTGDYRLTYITSSIQFISGYQAKEFLENPSIWVNSIHPDDFEKARFPEEIPVGATFRRDYRLRRKDGSWRHVFDILRVVRFSDDLSECLLGVLVDVTDRVNAEIAKQNTLDQLLEANKMASLGRMAGTIAHEVNNPLAIVIGKARQLVEILEESDDRALAIKFAKVIDETAHRIVRIVNGMRAVSRQSERDAFVREDLRKIIEGSVAICEAKFKFADIPLAIPKFGKKIEIQCREAEISQVLINLLSNAFDAIETLDERWVNVDMKQTGSEWVDIAVTDSGKTIPDDLREKILEPFFTTKCPGKGTGLGLSVSKGIVEDHGGQLYLDDSSPNTRFVVRLPVPQK
ncbi:MAG: ATP-binding protein [Oligoflexales bacterium]